MATKHGRMPTGQPARHAKQLAGHWEKRGPATEEDGATVLRWETGQVIVLRPADGAPQVEVSVPDDGDVTASPTWSRSTSSGSGAATNCW